MESVPGAVATGLTLASGNDAAPNDWFRTRLRLYPVATAPGTDLIPKLTLSTAPKSSRLNLKTDVHRPDRLRQRGDSNQISAGFGVSANVFQRYAVRDG